MLRENQFNAPWAWRGAIGDRVRQQVWAARLEGRQATLAFSGGRTPAAYLPALGRRRDIAWADTQITLADERCVTPFDRRSNEGLLRRHLGAWRPVGRAPTITPLHQGAVGAWETHARNAAITPLLPLDLVILGLGTDGHVASLFPDAREAWHVAAPSVRFRRPVEDFDRVSLTLRTLAQARCLAVACAGDDKWDTWTEIKAEGRNSGSPLAELLALRREVPGLETHILALRG